MPPGGQAPGRGTGCKMRMEPGRPRLPAGGHPPLLDDEVHVWSAPLDLDRESTARLRCLLSRDERDRAERYRSATDRDRFVVARGLLRCILGRYLGTPPERLRFCFGSHGKPSLAGKEGGADLEFSVSHSSGLALYALARHRQVGIDVEQVRPIGDIEQLVERYFSLSEQAAFRALSRQQQLEGFYRCWTRKEAFVKAKGLGLTFPLDRFEVSVAPGEPAQVLKVSGDSSEGSRWELVDLQPAPGYIGAAAFEGYGLRMRRGQWAQ